MSDAPVALIVGTDSERAAKYTEWLSDTYTVRTAPDGEAALWHFDDGVDVVLLDQALPDISVDELLGQLEIQGVECQYGLLKADEPGSDTPNLEFDDHVQQPVDREELRSLVERLEARNDVEKAVSSYLSVLSKRKILGTQLDADELDANPRYQALTSELRGRRRQIESVLNQVGDVDGEPSLVGGSVKKDSTPIYKSSPLKFYGLWFLATLSYGVGDIFSTVYVIEFTGIQEANPVIETLLTNFGMGGFYLFKLLVFFVLVSISVQGARTKDRFSYYWPPLLATILGIGLTVWNVSLIL